MEDYPPPFESGMPCTELPLVALNNVYLTPSCVGLIKVKPAAYLYKNVEINPEYRLIDYAWRGNEFYVVVSGGPTPHYIKQGTIIGRCKFFVNN